MHFVFERGYNYVGHLSVHSIKEVLLRCRKGVRGGDIARLFERIRKGWEAGGGLSGGKRRNET
jgi:hypothetical protein